MFVQVLLERRFPRRGELGHTGAFALPSVPPLPAHNHARGTLARPENRGHRLGRKRSIQGDSSWYPAAQYADIHKHNVLILGTESGLVLACSCPALSVSLQPLTGRTSLSPGCANGASWRRENERYVCSELNGPQKNSLCILPTPSMTHSERGYSFSERCLLRLEPSAARHSHL